MNVNGFFRLTVFLSLLIGHKSAYASYFPNLTQGSASLSRSIYDLHMLMFYICLVIGIITFGAMFYAIIWHRKSRGVVAKQFHHNTTVEIIWTLIPALILILMAIPATKVLLQMDDSSDSYLTIKATGLQWKWHYSYLDHGIGFTSNLATPYSEIHGKKPKSKNYLLEVDRNIVVPVGKKIRILTTSNDVIHSWYVPELGVKKDAVPGFINETWTLIEKPGIYRGQCTELCGALHGYMPIVVEALPVTEYENWLQKQKEL